MSIHSQKEEHFVKIKKVVPAYVLKMRCVHTCMQFIASHDYQMKKSVRIYTPINARHNKLSPYISNCCHIHAAIATDVSSFRLCSLYPKMD